MELRQYIAKVDLAKQTELGKVKLIAYYYCNTEAKSTFMLRFLSVRWSKCAKAVRWYCR